MPSRSMPSLPAAVAGERRELTGKAGRLLCYVGGPQGGAPLLLVHSINAAASAYEMKPIYEWAVAQGRRVFAPDLPGFGLSDRSARDYTIRLYTDAVHDVLGLIADEQGSAAIDAAALSLGSEFLARAAIEAPARFRTLTLITPTGFARGSDRLRAAPGASREVPGIHAAFNGALAGPLWGQRLFDLLVSRASIGFFLRKTNGSAAVDPGLWDYAYLTTHQPGARHAPFAFLSGKLFARDIRSVYEALAVPVWVPHATRGDFADFSDAGWARARGNWTFSPMPTGAMPHFEEPAQFCAQYADFLARHGAG
jgi:pimeloyl-ACP methyl ester carboxylesterase